ncbi:DUF2189 domain-containing protein [Roseospirillum parvum]|uniref:Uncharacterized membrane protein n=1 Tax=Roseospirillum parvum TaxID=83401 RepID=A0A1G7UCU4_9PROT|nr:DUF2189 domain-containing protein [Roseospirillum parvum]SDG45274.1 Uncharacterized membrane protein [Roseospirillum parvum]
MIHQPTEAGASGLEDRLPGQSLYPTIRTVGVEQSARWLAAGWHDLKRNPLLSLGHGGVFFLLSAVVTGGALMVGQGGMILPLISGFMIVAPVLVVGLYEISRRQESGAPLDLDALTRAMQASLPRLAGVGLGLSLLLLVWLEAALIVFALFYGGDTPPLDQFVSQVLAAPQAPLFLLVGTLVGGALAGLAFALSVVSLPLLVEREVSALEAMGLSLAATWRNRRVLVGWAAMIALTTAVGLLTAYVGLIVLLPLLGHASWHAYRDLLAPPP